MRRLRWSVAAVLAAVACSAESEEGVGLQLVLDTDMTVPESVNRVGLYVQHTSNGRSQLLLSREEKPIHDLETGTYSVRFAATLAIQGNGADPSDRVRARFIAFDDNGAAINMREMVTAIPTDGVRAVRLPLLFLNQGQVIDTQPGTVGGTGANVGLQQTEGDGSDVFTRYRTRGCGEEETRDEVGACVSIHVTARPLSELAEKDTCIHPQICFGAGLGVRVLPLLDCRVDVPQSTGIERDDFALAVQNPQGYLVDGEGWQPVDGALYNYRNGGIELSPALCQRVKGTTQVRISARCTEKQSNEPICAPWREPQRPFRAPGEGLFIDDPTPLTDGGTSTNDATIQDADAGVVNPDTDADADASDTIARDASADANETIQEDASAVELDSWSENVNLEEIEGTLRAFVVDPEQRVWLLGNQIHSGALGQANRLQGIGGDEALTSIELGPEVLVNGEKKRVAYFLSEWGSSYLALSGDDELTPILLADGDGHCNDEFSSVSVTVGRLGEAVAAVYPEQSGLVTTFGGLLAEPTNACLPSEGEFEINAEAETYIAGGRGTSMGGSWYLPARYGLFEIKSDGTRKYHEHTWSYGVAGNQVEFKPLSFIAVSESTAFVLPREQPAPWFKVTRPNGMLSIEPLLNVPIQEPVTRHAYGGHGKLCVQLDDPSMSVSCFQLDAASGKLGALTIADFVGPLPNHLLYGDENYVYFARACDGAAPQLKVRAIPWSRLGDAGDANRWRVDLTCPIP